MLPLHPVSPLPIFTLLFAFTLYVQLTSAACCFPNDDSICADNRPVQGWCCGHGRCNIFCCNCDFGCLGLPPTPKSKSNTDTAANANIDSTSNSNTNMAVQYAVCTASTGSSIFTGDEDCAPQLFQSLDVDGTGKMSLAQYLGWYAMRNAGAGAGADAGDIADLDDEFMFGAVEYFHRFDADGDGFVDEVEMRRAIR